VVPGFLIVGEKVAEEWASPPVGAGKALYREAFSPPLSFQDSHR